MTDAIIEFFRTLFNNDFLTVAFISFLPIVELRGAIPAALLMGMEWYAAFGLAYLGSSIVAPVLLLLLRPVLEWLKKIKFFARFANAIEDMFASKAQKIALKAGKEDSKKREEWIKIIGVYLFVALPLPLTGVWTGSAVAVFLGLPFFKSLFAVLAGNLTAGAIMTLLSVFLKEYLDLVLNIFLVLVVLLLLLFIAKVVIRMMRMKKAEKSQAGGNKVDGENSEIIIGDGLREDLTDKEDAEDGKEQNTDGADKAECAGETDRKDEE